MRSLRLLVAPVLLIGIAVAPGVDAAACRNQIVDPEGDAHSKPMGVNLLPDHKMFYSPDRDVLSGNVATGAKTVVVVLRLKSTAPDYSTVPKVVADQASADWVVAFKIGGTDYAFGRHRDQYGGHSNWFTVNNNKVAEPPVKQDATSITWTVSRALLPSLRTTRPTKVLTEIHAFTNSAGGTSDVGHPTAAGKRYVDRAPSCVRAA